MRVQVFENQGAGAFRGLRDEDELLLAWEGFVHDDGNTEAILDAVFAFLNQDDRPNGTFRRSTSVGDVITLMGGPRRLLESYAIERGAGFKKLTSARTASMKDRIYYAREQRASGRANVTRIPTTRSTP